MAAICSQGVTDALTTAYLADLDHMTKVVLKAESEQAILDAAKTLSTNGIPHYVWHEQPENIVTALATAPRERDVLKPLLANFKLFR